MTNNYENTQKLSKIAEKSKFIESEIISKIFKKVKNRGILTDSVKINVDTTKEKREEATNKAKAKKTISFGEQIYLHRIMKGYSQAKVGRYLGISECLVGQYELGRQQIKDCTRIEKIIKLLEIEEPNLSEYQKFLMNAPNARIVKYMKKNNISFHKLGKMTGIDSSDLKRIITQNKIISELQYNRMKDTIYNEIIRDEKELKTKYEDEEEEME